MLQKSILQHFPVIFDLLLQSQSVPKAYFKPFKASQSTIDLFWSILMVISTNFTAHFVEDHSVYFCRQFCHSHAQYKSRPILVKFGLRLDSNHCNSSQIRTQNCPVFNHKIVRFHSPIQTQIWPIFTAESGLKAYPFQGSKSIQIRAQNRPILMVISKTRPESTFCFC
jgi:hypothetical protein